MNEEKITVIISLLVIIIFMVWNTIANGIPELKKIIGSSDKLLNTEKYSGIIEVKLNDSTPNFILLTNKSNQIYHILFFDKESLCLYNQNIEGMKIQDAMDRIVRLLRNNEFLTTNTKLNLIMYKENDYNTIKTSLTKSLQKHKVETPILETKSTIQEKAELFNITNNNESEILKELDEYSKEIIITKENIEKVYEDKDELTEQTSKKYANNIYIKLENYIEEQKIINQDRYNTTMPISLIPADQNALYYPTANSWYYVENSKLYAYIEFDFENNKYSYCYKGSIDLYQKGEC